MARSRMSSEMDSENDSEGVSRTISQPDGNTSPQSTSVSIPRNDVKKSLEGMVIPPEEIESDKRRRTKEIRDREKERSILINDKLKLAVLYFLCAVLRGPEKAHQQIDDNLIKMVEDLDWCDNYPWGRKSYQYLMTQVQKLDIDAKCKYSREKLARWNNHAFILPLMLLPFECIPALTPTYAEPREDVQGPVPRICRWKTTFNRQQASSLDQILHAVGESTNISSILVPTLAEQKANHMIGFAPYDDDSDAIVDNWANILMSGRRIFWEKLLYDDLEGRRNFLNGGTERVQGRNRENPEDIIHEQHTSQEGATAAEQSRYLPSIPTVNESIPPQASSHADNSMVLRELQALKQTMEKMSQTMEKMSTDHESRLLQFERLITKNNNRVDMLTNIVSRLVQQQSETRKGGDRAESSGGRGESSGGVDVRLNAGGDNEAHDDIYAPTDVGFGTEISAERDMEDSPLNEIFYQTPTCSSDKDREEDILDVGQQKKRPKRHLKKSKYKRTPYTDPGPRKMMFRKGSIKEFDPLHLPDDMRKSFEDYKNSVPKPPFTSGLGITRAWDFFDQILTEHFWLLSDHIEEAMYGIRKKQAKYRDVINQDVVILDDIFSQLLVMNANDDAIYDSLMSYVKGDSPRMGKCWNGAKAIYFPYNLYDISNTNVAEKERGKHWVSVKVDLISAELVVFDCSWKFTEKVKLDRFMEPVQKMIPLLLQKSGYFSHLNPSPWPYRRPINHPQNEKS
ncbi:hypothetical protein TIFTF001_050941 [Ficus carica]|uniref:Ubiquitin-like protease family profile domain-containing protein n=1 Tax=Ficus carica TaxID=3494 RepID=A0AA88CJ73_FICCA|nr:hypothetical protein TIFTF001_050941 [Ficus carica]